MNKIFNSLEFIGNIIVSNKKKKPILQIWRDNKKYYIFDVVPFTNFVYYYVYEVSEKKIINFLKNKEMQAIAPAKNQIVYKTHFFDHRVLEMYRYMRNLDEIFSTDDDDYECADETIIKQRIKIKNNVETT